MNTTAKGATIQFLTVGVSVGVIIVLTSPDEFIRGVNAGLVYPLLLLWCVVTVFPKTMTRVMSAMTVPRALTLGFFGVIAALGSVFQITTISRSQGTFFEGLMLITAIVVGPLVALSALGYALMYLSKKHVDRGVLRQAHDRAGRRSGMFEFLRKVENARQVLFVGFMLYSLYLLVQGLMRISQGDASGEQPIIIAFLLAIADLLLLLAAIWTEDTGSDC